MYLGRAKFRKVLSVFRSDCGGVSGLRRLMYISNFPRQESEGSNPAGYMFFFNFEKTF